MNIQIHKYIDEQICPFSNGQDVQNGQNAQFYDSK